MTALVRTPHRLERRPGLTVRQADALATAALAEALQGHEAVVSAFSGHGQADVHGCCMRGMHSIVAATRQAAVKRLLVVGGAGSLEVAPGVQLVDTPEFPPQWLETARGARDALALLRGEGGRGLDWTMLSPAAHLEPGPRTGRFIIGSDALVTDRQGNSRISLADYAVAMIDELEQPRHLGRRFTVGYREAA
ncbi:MAG: NAD(P)H-binding protein [Pseudomonadota bacterium]|nr:MAG: 3-beta hydroxysteroid dehydrogenase [Pseudomonadota bacterium]